MTPMLYYLPSTMMLMVSTKEHLRGALTMKRGGEEMTTTTTKRRVALWLLASLLFMATFFAFASANSAITHDAYAAKAGGTE